MKLLVIVHIAVTWYLIGLIWTVQMVQYPLFSKVDAENFITFAGLHAERITMIVMFPMFIELGTALLLLLAPPKNFPVVVLVLGLILLGVIWFSTVALQIPLHNQLTEGFNEQAIRRLNTTNWIRTIAWSLRGVITLLLLWNLVTP